MADEARRSRAAAAEEQLVMAAANVRLDERVAELENALAEQRAKATAAQTEAERSTARADDADKARAVRRCGLNTSA